MNKFLMQLTYVVAFFLSGCAQHTAALQQAAEQSLEPAYVKKLPGWAKTIKFSANGVTFFVAGSYNFIYLYETANFQRRVTVQPNDAIGHEFKVPGVGYVDDNTWYFATDDMDPNILLEKASITIQQIDPQRDLYKQRWEYLSSTPVWVNSTHIAYYDKMLNWHNGDSYEVILAHPAKLGYRLTSDDRVISQNFGDGAYLFYDPLKQDGEFWNTGSWGPLLLSPDAQYGLVGSDRGKCELWQLQLPKKELLGRCGQASLFGGKRWNHAVFQRDSRAFARAFKNEIAVYTTQPFKRVFATAMAQEVTALALEGGRLAAADTSGAILVWDIETGQLLGGYGRDTPAPVTSLLDLQPGGNKLITAQSEQLTVFELHAEPRVSAALDEPRL